MKGARIFLSAVIAAAVCIAGAAGPLQAQEQPAERPLIVATREIPPFAMRDDDGRWSGITIELWEMIADRLGLSYTYQLSTLDGMLTGLQDGTVGVAAAALSITSERERVVDFSHPFYHTGLGIAIVSRPGSIWWRVIRGLVSWQFLRVVGVLALILMVFGFFIWLFERRRNPAQFGGNAKEGLGSGFWWAAVTMTTVGYGDKAPVTLGGRVIALIWMFSGIIIISSITAAITSALTVASLGSGIQGANDLPRVITGTVRNTTSVQYFSERGMKPRLYDTIHDALKALSDGEIEALVYDAPVLAYLVNQHYTGRLRILSRTFEQQQYGIALPFDSPLRQGINHALLEVIEGGELDRIRQRYLGQ